MRFSAARFGFASTVALLLAGCNDNGITSVPGELTASPDVLDYGSADFTRRNQAILEGEKAALAALPQIREQVRKLQAQRLAQAREKQARADAAKAALAVPAAVACEDEGWRWNPLKKKDEACGERR